MVEDAPQLDFLIGGVAERLGGEVSARRDGLGRMHPREEVVDERADVRIAERHALGLGRILQYTIGRIDRANPQQALQADWVLADRRLEEVSTTVRETADEPHPVFAILGAAALEDVIDAARIRL